MPRDLESQRAAKRRYYEKNKQLYLDKSRKRAADTIEFIRSVKDVPCADCGKRYPYYVMDFDHRGDDVKLGDIGESWVRWGRAKLIAEIAKCDVVCANCHRERTHQRRGM